MEKPNVRPPNLPWQEIQTIKDSGGYLSYYYSDELSSIPIRAVTKLNDNKADPNIETGTYGLFSKCNRVERKSIVARGINHIYFVTYINGERYLTGYYHLKWYTKLGEGDFCLAADRIKFIKYPISLMKIDKRYQTTFAKKFRISKLITWKESWLLKKLISVSKNNTDEYIKEIHRLERFNLLHSGYRYRSNDQKEEYFWDCPKAILLLAKANMGGVNNGKNKA